MCLPPKNPQEYWHLQLPGCRNTLIYAHTTSRTLPTCDISLGSPTVAVPEAGDFVEQLEPYQCVFPCGLKNGAWGSALPSSSSGVENEWSYSSTSLTCLHGVCMGNFTFILPRILTNKYGSQTVKPMCSTAVELLDAVRTLIFCPPLQIKDIWFNFAFINGLLHGAPAYQTVASNDRMTEKS